MNQEHIDVVIIKKNDRLRLFFRQANVVYILESDIIVKLEAYNVRCLTLFTYIIYMEFIPFKNTTTNLMKHFAHPIVQLDQNDINMR